MGATLLFSSEKVFSAYVLHISHKTCRDHTVGVCICIRLLEKKKRYTECNVSYERPHVEPYSAFFAQTFTSFT